MSKADRNRQTARAKIARMQAAGAQRRRHRNWIAGIGAAVRGRDHRLAHVCGSAAAGAARAS